MIGKLKKNLTLGLAALALCSTAVISNVSAEEYPSLNLRLAHFVPSNTAGAQWEQWWADEVEKRSNGQIKVKIFWAGSMGGPKEILKLTGTGAVQLGATAQGYFTAELPVAGNASHLRVHETPQQAVDTWKRWQEDPQTQADLENNGVIALYHQGSNPYRLFCTKPVTTVAELNGLRVRVPGAPYWPEYFAKVGVVPVSIPYSEMYDALQKGTVDCSLAAHEQAISGKFYEVAKYAIDLNFGAQPVWGIFVNRKLFNEWPENVQKLMLDVSNELMEREPKEAAELAEKTINEDFPAHGVTYVKFEEAAQLDEKAGSMIDMWAADLKQRGFGDAVERLRPVLTEMQAKFPD
tara:strand:+ start:2905 stop:3954 length:1050 start_codon:yes stop_codon:yes gene_type:complete